MYLGINTSRGKITYGFRRPNPLTISYVLVVVYAEGAVLTGRKTVNLPVNQPGDDREIDRELQKTPKKWGENPMKFSQKPLPLLLSQLAYFLRYS